MKLIRTKKFLKFYRSLPKEVQKVADRKIKILVENPRHPSLRVKKVEGIKGIWEARITENYRLTFEIYRDRIIFRVIGKHNQIFKSP